MSAPLIDLDAPRRESAHPDGIPVRFGGRSFTLPAELPLDTLTGLILDPDLDLPGILSRLNRSTTATFGNDVVDTLLDRADLPHSVLKAFTRALESLFGVEAYAEFTRLRPSVPDYIRLIKALWSLYGVSLGEAARSLTSSTSGGATSKRTSRTTTPGSTFAASSGVPDSPASSESDG
ncbi:hypothetical protein [Actinacidiphila sp. bgisy160]|uniref:hypothetical protein n=1 Tax=Actinacidiphila sp. bgisy160 TaxID=3413796 RepID=UPI003D72F755